MRGFFASFSLFAALLCIFAASSCGNMAKNRGRVQDWAESSKIRVLVTTAHVGSIVEAVGGDKVAVLELIQGESDPHSYQLVKGDDEKFSMAQLVFYSGLGLEHNPSLMRQLTTAQAIALGDAICRKHPAAAISIDGATDPHLWMDAYLWSQGADAVAEALAAADPEHAPFFHDNAQKLQAEWLRFDEQARRQFLRLPEQTRVIVTTHDAFNYFTRRYLAQPEEVEKNSWQWRCRAPEGLAPDSQISTQDIMGIAQYIVDHHVSVIFAEVGINRDSIEKLREVLQEKNYSVAIVQEALFSDSMGPRGTESGSYLGMMSHNTKTIYKYLAGRDMVLEAL